MGCGFDLVQGEGTGSKQGMQPPPPPVSSSSSGQSSIATLHQEQQRLQGELSTVKEVLEAQEALNAKCHEDILSQLAALNAKLSPLLPETPFSLDFSLVVPIVANTHSCYFSNTVLCLFVYASLTWLFLFAE